jgi:hypothetical protein
MDFEKLAEEKIREAIERGEFEGLGGEGRRIDHTEYFNTPAEHRVGYSLLKSNKFVPGEVQLMREKADLQGRAESGKGDSREFQKLLNEKRMALAMTLERNHAGSRRR